MSGWEPASSKKVQVILDRGLDKLHPKHQSRFNEMRVPFRQVPIEDYPGEYVFVVAEHDGQILYWSDLEDGWELGVPTPMGGIQDRGCNQFELSHIMWQLFGDPDQRI